MKTNTSRLHIFAKHLSNHYDSYRRSSLTLTEAVMSCKLLVRNGIPKVYACSCRSHDSCIARLVRRRQRWWWWEGRKTPWNSAVIFLPSLSPVSLLWLMMMNVMWWSLKAFEKRPYNLASRTLLGIDCLTATTTTTISREMGKKGKMPINCIDRRYVK